MRNTFFILLLSFLPSLVSASPLFTQGFFIQTSIDSAKFCPGTSQSIPVTVQNLIGIDSFNLVLNFDPNVISYKSYQFLNTQLTGGSLSVSSQSGSLTLNWHRSTAASITNDTLIMLVFKGISGNTSLSWDTLTPGNCIYHDFSGNLSPAHFTSGLASVRPPIYLLLTQIDPTCTGKCNANFMANVSGGLSPYTYLWNGKPGRFDSIQTNLCDGANSILITDRNGCELDSLFQIDGMPGAKVTVKIMCETDTTTVLFRENPVLTFSFDEIFPTHVIEAPLWEFGDGDTARSFNPTHVYAGAAANKDNFYLMTLHVTNQNGCDTIITQRIPIKDQKLRISNVIVPTGSEKNRTFTIFDENNNVITNQYIRLELYVFDRWGRKLYANKD